MMAKAKADAVAAIGKLATAAQTLPSGETPDWIRRVVTAVEADTPDTEEVSDSIRSLGSFLGHGEWDRILVEKGGLDYLDLTQARLALLTYCESLDLEPNARMGVEIQLGRLRHALRSHGMREQAGGGQAATRSESR